MKDVKLSYEQLRQILALSISNATIKAKLEDFLAGRVTKITELDLLALITESEADMDLIRILSGADPATLDAFQGLEYISDFFAYIASNKARFKAMLANSGFRLEKAPKTTPSKRSK